MNTKTLRDYAISKGSSLYGSTIGISKEGIISEMVHTEEQYRQLVNDETAFSRIHPEIVATLHINHNGTFCAITPRLTDEA